MLVHISSLMFAIVLFGQLFFGALNYYFNISNPSYYFWMPLFLSAGMLFLYKREMIKPVSADILLLLFLLFVFFNFKFSGESNASVFYNKFFLFMILPYVAGRLVGLHSNTEVINYLRWIFLLYVLVIGFEVFRNPQILQSDRLILFNESYDQNKATGGDGTLHYIGYTFGSIWVAAIAIIAAPNFTNSALTRKLGSWIHFEKDKAVRLTRAQSYVLLILIPILILLFGSRSGLVAMMLSGASCWLIAKALAKKKKTNKLKSYIWISLMLPVLILSSVWGYSMLSEERKMLIAEFTKVFDVYDHVSELNDCSEQGSFMTRVTQAKESVRMFASSPLVGVGTSNFGLHYCAKKQEFSSPHNTTLHVIAEQGLLGTLLFLLFIGAIFLSLYAFLKDKNQNMRKPVWIFASLFVLLLFQIQFTGNLFIDYQLFLLSGFLVSTVQHNKLQTQRQFSLALKYKMLIKKINPKKL